MTIYSESSPAKLRWDFYGKHASSFKTLMAYQFKTVFVSGKIHGLQRSIARRTHCAIPNGSPRWFCNNSKFDGIVCGVQLFLEQLHRVHTWPITNLNDFYRRLFSFISHQSFVSSGTNLNLHFAKGEDGVVTREYLDFDKEPGKVGVGKIREISWVYQWWNNSVREEGFDLGRSQARCEGIWIFLLTSETMSQW